VFERLTGARSWKANRDSGSVDLSANRAVTTALLRNPLEWRIRAVEQVGFDTASTCSRHRTLQCAPLRPILDEEVPPSAETAFIALYFASVPRGALLDLDLEGPGGAVAHLLKREEIAAREEAYLYSLASDIGLPVSSAVRNLIMATLAYTKTTHESLTATAPMDNLADYLADGLGVLVPEVALTRWRNYDNRALASLRSFDDSRDVDTSPTAHPVIALPFMDLGEAVVELDGIESALRGYAELLEELRSSASEGTLEWDFLSSLADYGHNYDLMAATEVPLDRPFVIKYSERRDIEVERYGYVSQDIVTADAGSNHVVLFTTDPSVEIRNPKALVPNSTEKAFGLFGTRSSTQTFAVYAHDRDRDYRATFRAQLKTSLRIRGTVYAAAGLLIALTVGVFFQPPHTVSNFALIVGPTSLAASVLLFREQSTLGSTLRRLSTGVLTGALVALLVVSVVSYVWTTVDDLAPSHAPVTGPSATTSTVEPTPRG
jgi:hypothetical protein